MNCDKLTTSKFILLHRLCSTSSPSYGNPLLRSNRLADDIGPIAQFVHKISLMCEIVLERFPNGPHEEQDPFVYTLATTTHRPINNFEQMWSTDYQRNQTGSLKRLDFLDLL